MKPNGHGCQDPQGQQVATYCGDSFPALQAECPSHSPFIGPLGLLPIPRQSDFNPIVSNLESPGNQQV